MNASGFIACVIGIGFTILPDPVIGSVTTVLSTNDSVGNFKLQVFKNTDTDENPSGTALVIPEAGFGAGGGRIQVSAPGGLPRNVQAPTGWGFHITEDELVPNEWQVTWVYEGIDADDPVEQDVVDGTIGEGNPLEFGFFSQLGSAFQVSPRALNLDGEIIGRVSAPPPFYFAVLREPLRNVATLIPGSNVPPEALGFPAVDVIVNADDTVIDLTNGFQDQEDGANGLAYAVVSNTDESLFAATAVDPESHQLTLAYALNQAGSAVLVVEATDSGGATALAEVSVRILGGKNVAPTLDQIGDKAISELQTLDFVATAVDGDDPPDALTFSLTNPPAGAAITSDGKFAWTPTESQGPGEYSFEVLVSDNGLGNYGAAEIVTVAVGEVNLAPVLDPIGGKAIDETTGLSFTATATDGDLPANTLSFTLDGAPAGASITATGQFTWTPPEQQGGQSYTFDIVVSDDGVPPMSDRETIAVAVNKTNSAPRLTGIGNQEVSEGAVLTFEATATDSDLPVDAVIFSLEGAPAGAAITAGGRFAWAPSELQGGSDYVFDVVVTDSGTPTMSDRETITVTVNEDNRAPVLTAIEDQLIDELTLLSLTAVASDADDPPNALTFSLVNAPVGAAITPEGVISWTPTEAQGPGEFSFDVVVTDNGTGNLSASQSVAVKVNEANSAPVLGSVGDRAVKEDERLSFAAIATDGDVPINRLTYSLSDAPSGASITTDGKFNWTPTELQGGKSYEFDIVVTDDGAPVLSEKETVTITVSEDNKAPVLEMISSQVIDELKALSLTVEASDGDDPPNALTFSLANAPAGASITAAGAFSWTPTESQGPGVFSFNVVVMDNGEGELSDSQTLSLTVLDVNSPPVLQVVGNRSVDEEKPLTFTATTMDSDEPANTSTFSLSGEPTGAVMTKGGKFTWTPTEQQGGKSYEFDVVVIDDGTPALSDRETITVAVRESNESPVLEMIDSQVIEELEALTLTAVASDGDHPQNELTFSLNDAPAGASISSRGVFNWTPTENQGPGKFTFDMVVTDDGEGNLTASRSVTVTVNEVNSKPILNTIGNKTIDESGTLMFVVTASDEDQPMNQLTLSLADAPRGATITADGLFIWQLDESQGGQDYTFAVVVTDNGEPSLSDSERITVTALRHSPFRVDRITRNAISGEVSLQWHGQRGFDYLIEWSEDLVEWDALPDVVSGSEVSDEILIHVLPPEAEAAMYYRIKAEFKMPED